MFILGNTTHKIATLSVKLWAVAVCIALNGYKCCLYPTD